ncbi:ribonuclease HII [Candidatus Nitrospira neomarina]|uniref:Ribonuclease HII n=1 Tax=Candidatus Nitrospira neomarina TaxID=3020899 RepID=A0AA96GHV4_9BACT|nr:ribonuclease HII [Candidatus Nitrospira neomarina]WNM60455.1 ribonuclease HII [Candidatus Nitrospira neomarina]
MHTDSPSWMGTGPTDFFEQAARALGYRRIAGLDEAGRGPLAGPVVAAIVILPRRWSPVLLDDSKLLTEQQRNVLYEAITTRAIAWAIGMASAQEIDELNILGATRLAGCRALSYLATPPDYLLLDALHLPRVSVPQRPVIKGDQLSRSIAAASILAKVARDRMMISYHERFPQYQFHLHKGYSTPEHLRRLQQFGPCPGHRRSFGPVQACLNVPSLA